MEKIQSVYLDAVCRVKDASFPVTLIEQIVVTSGCFPQVFIGEGLSQSDARIVNLVQSPYPGLVPRVIWKVPGDLRKIPDFLVSNLMQGM